MLSSVEPLSIDKTFKTCPQSTANNHIVWLFCNNLTRQIKLIAGEERPTYDYGDMYVKTNY